MKALIISLILLPSISALGDTYTGVVFGVKHFANGGVAVDLDGKYPNEKMALYVPPASGVAVGTLPIEGSKMTATGTVEQYKCQPEIKIVSKDQWHW